MNGIECPQPGLEPTALDLESRYFTHLAITPTDDLEVDFNSVNFREPEPSISSFDTIKRILTIFFFIEQNFPHGFTGIEKLKRKLLTVLKQIHKEKEEERVIVDIWCHFGHAYITKVDEGKKKDSLFSVNCGRYRYQFDGIQTEL